MFKSLLRALYDKIFYGFYFNCYSSSLDDLQTQAHKAAITDKTKLMNPIVMTIKAKVSRSAHQTPNFTNPEFQFPQFKVL